MKKIIFSILSVAGLSWLPQQQPAPVAKGLAVLKPETYLHYVNSFNQNDNEQFPTYIPNAQAWSWMQNNIPFFDCSDKQLEEMYYFRWWTFRKHIKQTPDGFVITEFLPNVPWSRKYNTISCAAGHHFYEGRWLRDRNYLKDYAYFWFKKGGEPRQFYSFWAADAIRAWALVTQDNRVAIDLYPDLVANYQAWEKRNLDPNGLFWQNDGNDGMEISIGGNGYRPTINSYMYAELMALSDISVWAWKKDQRMDFKLKATKLRELVEKNLWDGPDNFYKTLPKGEKHPVDVRELIGYVPWCFNLPEPGHELAWKQITDTLGFKAPYGPTTAERRDPRFMFSHEHECLWNGPSWPYATSQTLTAMANLLNNYKQNYVGKKDYLELLRTYARSQHLKLSDGKVIPFIDEDLNPLTGDWIARSTLYSWPKEKSDKAGGKDRGRDYNHSTFNDLIITGLVGLRPRMDQAVEVNPLVPEEAMEYFCLDGIRYHDCNLTILWDRTGKRYNKGKGLHIYANEEEIGSSPHLQWTLVNLPETAPGWKKYADNPLIGGGRPTPEVAGKMADVAVTLENGRYRLYGSWYYKGCIPVFESTDGIHWGNLKIALDKNPKNKWEESVSRPSIVKREDGYHMWYTGQSRSDDNEDTWTSDIGYATSPDGINWKRMSEKPVLVPDVPWEKASLMNAHVLWNEDKKLYEMWYSGGEKFEPDAIGYATSKDGLNWTKYAGNPVFRGNPENVWERDKVAGCQVFRKDGWYYIVYIGYRDKSHAQIGIARSRDGISGWERHPDNPLIRTGQNKFDNNSCYKPYMIFNGKDWMLYYNGCIDWLERIGVAVHKGEDLGFDK